MDAQTNLIKLPIIKNTVLMNAVEKQLIKKLEKSIMKKKKDCPVKRGHAKLVGVKIY
jgi:hypothetical protein